MIGQKRKRENDPDTYTNYLLEIRSGISIISDNIKTIDKINRNYIQTLTKGFDCTFNYIKNVINQNADEFINRLVDSIKIIKYYFTTYEYFIHRLAQLKITNQKQKDKFQENKMELTAFLTATFPHNLNLPRIIHTLLS